MNLEVSLVSTWSYLYVSEQVVNLAKQNEGWLRQTGEGNKSRNRANRKLKQKANENVQASLL